jgi:hypothetical protein
MAGRESDVNGWYKTFFTEQKKLPGECTVSLAQFDDVDYDVFVDWAKIENIPGQYNLEPRGGTNLRDSLAKSVKNLGEKLAKMNEEDRPSNVIVVVHTDGEENSSVEWSQEQLKDLITEHREKYSWQFTFLGADIDAFTVGTAMGIPLMSNLSSGNNSAGYATSAFISSAGVARLRSGVSKTLTYDQAEVTKAGNTKTTR